MSCLYHGDKCDLGENELERLAEVSQMKLLSDEWCEAMLEDYGMDYRKWYPKHE